MLQRYLDGELDDLTSAAVRTHLERCRRCGLEFETYRSMVAALRQSAPPDPNTLARLRRFALALTTEEPA